MSEDPLDIPTFLRRKGTPERHSRAQGQSDRDWIMPPIALGVVAPAVHAGCDTMQKMRNRTRQRYSDREVRRALAALIRSGDIVRQGRRYLSQRRTRNS